jgi:hypothetical protein
MVRPSSAPDRLVHRRRETLGSVSVEPDIATIWAEVQAALPEGWALDSLRCAGTGLAVDQRSEDWIAIALAPDGTELKVRAASPAAALMGLPNRVNG